MKRYGFTLCGPNTIGFISLMKYAHLFDDFIGNGAVNFNQHVTLGRHFLASGEEHHVFNRDFFQRVLDWLLFNEIPCLINFDTEGLTWFYPKLTLLEPWNPPMMESLAREEGYNDDPVEDRLAWRPYPPIV